MNVVLNPFYIRFSGSLKIGEIDSSKMTDLIKEGIPVARKAADAIKSSVEGMTYVVADALAGYLTHQLEVYDCSSFFTIAWIIYHQIDDFRANNVAPVRPAVGMEDLFNFCNVAAGAEAAPGQAQILAAAMKDGLPVFDTRRLLNSDINVLRLISRGPISVTVPVIPGVEPNIRPHVATSFETPTIRILLLTREGDYVPPAFVMPSAEDILASIAKLAVLSGNHDSIVKGYIRACTIVNGRPLYPAVVPVGAHVDWMTSIFEIHATAIPQPRFSNPIWTFMHQGKTHFDRLEVFKDDFNTLIGCNRAEATFISPLIAAWLSISFSTYFHMFNFGGRELNSIVGPPDTHGNARSILAQMLFNMDLGISRVFRLAPAMIAQTHDVVVNPLVFIGSRWSNEFVGMIPAHFVPARYWQGQWGFHVPYWGNPLALSDGMKAYADVWGYMSPPVSFNFSGEMTLHGEEHVKAWYAWMGDQSYEKTAAAKVKYRYVPYGVTAINVMRQHWGAEAAWNLWFEYITVNRGIARPAVMPVDLAQQPNYEPDHNSVVPGTLLTYEWTTKQVYSPLVTAQVLGQAQYGAMVADVEISSITAGTNLAVSSCDVPEIASFDALAIEMGMTDFVAGAVAVSKEN